MNIKLLIERLINDLDLLNGDIVLSYKEFNYITKYQYRELQKIFSYLIKTNDYYFKELNINNIKYSTFIIPIYEYFYSIVIPQKQYLNKVKKMFIKKWKKTKITQNNYINTFEHITNKNLLTLKKFIISNYFLRRY